MVAYEDKAGASYECPEHGSVPAAEAEKPTVRFVETKTRGVVVVVSCLDAVDESPATVLVPGRPFFLEDEWEAFKTMKPAEATRRWDRRVRDVFEEIAARTADPARTIYTGANA